MIHMEEKEFEEIFHRYYSPLCNYASKIISDEISAEDVVQNLFIQLWESEKLKRVKNTEHFLLQAVKFKCIDFLRTRNPQKNIPLENIKDAGLSGPDELIEEDIEPLFYYFTAKLPPKTREVFLLSRRSGMTYKEIADELDISVKTVENQMGRALRILKDLLKEHKYLLWLFMFRM